MYVADFIHTQGLWEYAKAQTKNPILISKAPILSILHTRSLLCNTINIPTMVISIILITICVFLRRIVGPWRSSYCDYFVLMFYHSILTFVHGITLHEMALHEFVRHRMTSHDMIKHSVSCCAELHPHSIALHGVALHCTALHNTVPTTHSTLHVAQYLHMADDTTLKLHISLQCSTPYITLYRTPYRTQYSVNPKP